MDPMTVGKLEEKIEKAIAHTRTLLMGEQKRTYLVHVPKVHDPAPRSAS
jgi:hypothetical protein